LAVDLRGVSTPNQNLSTRLFIQAALTAIFAPVNPGGKGFLVLTFALAAGAAGLGAWVRTGPAQTRNATLAFEAVAVIIGVVGLVHHTYVPGTIVGVATLIAVLNTGTTVRSSAPAAVAVPQQFGAQQFGGQPQFGQPQFGQSQFGQPDPSQSPFGQPAAAQPSYAHDAAATPAYAAAPTYATAPAAPAPAAGQWAADPTGRHHYRWWDGQAWTAHVSTNGATAVDPI
jgi:hypothetical protein